LICAHCKMAGSPTVHGKCPSCGKPWKEMKAGAKVLAAKYQKTFWKGAGVPSPKKFAKKVAG